MIAVIKGDIINSRFVRDADLWMSPLKQLLSQWGKQPRDWDFAWGDAFQIETPKIKDVLLLAFLIKACIKQVRLDENDRTNKIDVRLSIGIENKYYQGERVLESAGVAYIYAGEQFDKLKSLKTNLSIKSPWEDFDESMNLYLKLVDVLMEKWPITSAELAYIVLNNPNIKQQEIADQLNIQQSSVSTRWKNSNVDEILAVNQFYRKRIRKLLHDIDKIHYI